MGIPKSLDYKDFMNKSTSANPTTWDDMYRFFGNQGEITAALVKSLLYQPSTAYSIGAIVYSPNLPAGTIAKCTVAGTTGSTEPVWPAAGSAANDGTVRWLVENTKVTSAQDLTPYMKKTADSDLMMGVYKLIFGRTVISDDFRNTVPMFTIDATGGRGVNIKGPSVLVNGIPIATKTDLSDKLDKTGTAAAAIKATQDGEGNVIATTYIKTINNLKPDTSGNVNISTSGGGSNIIVDATLDSTSSNAIANKAVYAALNNKLDKNGTAMYASRDSSGNVFGTTYATKTELSKCVKSINNLTPDSSGNVNISTSGGGTNITVDTALSGTSNNAISNKAVYEALSGKLDKTGTATAAIKATQDGEGNVIATTYIKTINNLKPDDSGNINISTGGGSGSGVSTSTQNTWTAKQNFQHLKFNFESFATSRISGTYDSPSKSVAAYNVTGALTLDMSTLAGMIGNGDTSIFTAYIASNGSYALSITNAGTLKYAGSAADLAITASGLLLNIFLTKNTSGVVTSIAQATKLS